MNFFSGLTRVNYIALLATISGIGELISKNKKPQEA